MSSASAATTDTPVRASSFVCLLLESSGHRYGPQDGQDLSFDASKLPNPSLSSRQGTGKSSKLQQDFFQQPGVQAFFDALLAQILARCTDIAALEATRSQLDQTDITTDPDENDDDNNDEENRDEQGRVIQVKRGKTRTRSQALLVFP
jgi:hypothetical protein